MEKFDFSTDINNVSGFNPADYLMDKENEEGKYLPLSVKSTWFRKIHPTGRISHEILSTNNVIVIRARVYADKNDPDGSFIGEAIDALPIRNNLPDGKNLSDTEAYSYALLTAWGGAESKALSVAGFGIQYSDTALVLRGICDLPSAGTEQISTEPPLTPQEARTEPPLTAQETFTGNPTPPKNMVEKDTLSSTGQPNNQSPDSKECHQSFFKNNVVGISAEPVAEKKDNITPSSVITMDNEDFICRFQPYVGKKYSEIQKEAGNFTSWLQWAYTKADAEEKQHIKNLLLKETGGEELIKHLSYR